jgi:DNA-binding transcriptional regulator YiaG
MARKPAVKQPSSKKAPAVKQPSSKTAKAKRKEPLTTAEWRKIRIEYVKGKTTYQKLADKYGISAGHIRKRASIEGWRKKKRVLDTKVEQKVLERVCDARAKEFELIAKVNDRMGEVLDNLINFVSSQPPRKYDDLRGVESLTKAIAQVVQTKRDLYNVPTEIDRAKIEALRDKQKLDREKFAEEQAEKAASKQAAENTMIRVVVEGEEEEEPLDE